MRRSRRLPAEKGGRAMFPSRSSRMRRGMLEIARLAEGPGSLPPLMDAQTTDGQERADSGSSGPRGDRVTALMKAERAGRAVRVRARRTLCASSRRGICE